MYMYLHARVLCILLQQIHVDDFVISDKKTKFTDGMTKHTVSKYYIV